MLKRKNTSLKEVHETRSVEPNKGTFVFKISDFSSTPDILLKVCFERGWRVHAGTIPTNHWSVTSPYGRFYNYNHAVKSHSGGSSANSLTPQEADNWNLWWRTGVPSSANNKLLKPWQFTNHIPKGAQLGRKDNLARLVKCMKKIYGAIYDFTPLSYSIPLEYLKLAAECSRCNNRNAPSETNVVWICKPVGRSQGKGIFLFRNLSELTYDSSAIVQRYIKNPLLIGGYKFDLRLYVCVPSYRPPVVYMYKEGLVRFSTDKYSLIDIDNPYRHLTNCSINKLGPKYTECKERVGLGCKWTLKQLRLYLRQNGFRDWLLWQRISSLVNLTILAQAQHVPTCTNCFEFFGFDVLVDDDLRPWLIEVNINPGLANDCDVDTNVKQPLLHDLFDLLGLPVSQTGLSLYSTPSKSNVYDEQALDKRINNSSASVMSAANRWRRRQQKRNQKSYESADRLYNPRKSVLSASTTNSTGVVDTIWWNGKDWDDPVRQEGDWIRIFPFEYEMKSKQSNALPAVESNISESRTYVRELSKFLNYSRMVFKSHDKMAEDDELDEALRVKMKVKNYTWLPPKHK